MIQMCLYDKEKMLVNVLMSLCDCRWMRNEMLVGQMDQLMLSPMPRYHYIH